MLERLWRVKRSIKYRFVPHALILMYHRITTLENDPHLLAVTPQNFAAHLEVIQRYGSAVSLQEVVQALKKGAVPNHAVVITFDDGYADNLHQAKPLLERYEIPATVFVTAGQIGGRAEFWWDELDRLLLQPGVLPSRLRLGLNGDTQEWDLGDGASYGEADYQQNKDWHIERKEEPTIRHTIFQALFDRLYALPENDKQKALADLRAWAGTAQTARSSHRTLTADEMISLAASDLIEIGAHTMTHPLLGSLPATEQEAQIQQSKESLEAVLNMPVISFAFPHGSYSPETISILNESGFVTACTSDADTVWRSSDCHQLPRLGVRNWDQETFARWLNWWLHG